MRREVSCLLLFCLINTGLETCRLTIFFFFFTPLIHLVSASLCLGSLSHLADGTRVDLEITVISQETVELSSFPCDVKSPLSGFLRRMPHGCPEGMGLEHES